MATKRFMRPNPTGGLGNRLNFSPEITVWPAEAEEKVGKKKDGQKQIAGKKKEHKKKRRKSWSSSTMKGSSRLNK